MFVRELQAELRSRGLSTKGNKNTLIKRLQKALYGQGVKGAEDEKLQLEYQLLMLQQQNAQLKEQLSSYRLPQHPSLPPSSSSSSAVLDAQRQPTSGDQPSVESLAVLPFEATTLESDEQLEALFHNKARGILADTTCMSLVRSKIISLDPWDFPFSQREEKHPIAQKCRRIDDILRGEWETTFANFSWLTPELCQSVGAAPFEEAATEMARIEKAFLTSSPTTTSASDSFPEGSTTRLWGRPSSSSPSLLPRTDNLFNAIRQLHQVETLNWAQQNENWCRVNLWGSLFDFLLRDIPGVNLVREAISESASYTRDVTKIPDAEIATTSPVVMLSRQVFRACLLVVEEKAHIPLNTAAYKTNIGTHDITLPSYSGNNADCVKLARLMRDALLHRGCPSVTAEDLDKNPLLTAIYGVQWIGTVLWVSIMTRCFANYCLNVPLAPVVMTRDRAACLQTMLTLRQLIIKQLNFENSKTHDRYADQFEATHETPAKKGRRKGGDRDQGTKGEKGSGTTQGATGIRGGEGTVGEPLECQLVRAGEMRPCPPPPLGSNERWVLPRNQGRYQVTRRVGTHLWHGQRTSDGFPVMLKRLWTHPQAAMREISMHLCASTVSGVVSLLDCFWDIEKDDYHLETCFAVLVMPQMLPLTQCLPSANTKEKGECYHKHIRQIMDVAQVWEIACCLLETLQQLHDITQLIHLDIKPANLLLPLPPQELNGKSTNEDNKHESRIFLADFGLTRPAGTKLTFPVGTYNFTAPELLQLNGDKLKELEANETMDIWSFGHTLLCLLEEIGVSGKVTAGSKKSRDTSAMFQLINMCIAHWPKDRPTAKQAHNFLKNYFNKYKEKKSLEKTKIKD
ncbi:Serine/threonine-protein kinase sbk1 [Balamuthia mandrillaris]